MYLKINKQQQQQKKTYADTFDSYNVTNYKEPFINLTRSIF